MSGASLWSSNLKVPVEDFNDIKSQTSSRGLFYTVVGDLTPSEHLGGLFYRSLTQEQLNGTNCIG